VLLNLFIKTAQNFFLNMFLMFRSREVLNITLISQTDCQHFLKKASRFTLYKPPFWIWSLKGFLRFWGFGVTIAKKCLARNQSEKFGAYWEKFSSTFKIERSVKVREVWNRADSLQNFLPPKKYLVIVLITSSNSGCSQSPMENLVRESLTMDTKEYLLYKIVASVLNSRQTLLNSSQLWLNSKI